MDNIDSCFSSGVIDQLSEVEVVSESVEDDLTCLSGVCDNEDDDDDFNDGNDNMVDVAERCDFFDGVVFDRHLLQNCGALEADVEAIPEETANYVNTREFVSKWGAIFLRKYYSNQAEGKLSNIEIARILGEQFDNMATRKMETTYSSVNKKLEKLKEKNTAELLYVWKLLALESKKETRLHVEMMAAVAEAILSINPTEASVETKLLIAQVCENKCTATNLPTPRGQ
jgi:hypothetical protein